MKKLLFILLGIFVIETIMILTIKDIYIIDNGKSDIEVNSNIEILKEGIRAEYCTKLFKLFCKDVTNEITIENNPNLNLLNTIEVKYKIKHKLKEKEYTKKINIIDTTPPTIVLKGNELYCPNNFIEPGYEATDNYDKDLKEKVIINKIDNIVYYSVKDSSDNYFETQRVLNTDKTPTKILLNGYDIEYVLLGSKYNEPGYKVLDICGNELDDKVTVKSNVNTNKIGTYEITYSINNISTIRKVKVYKKQENITIIPTNKVIYLTFDDGPGPYTNKLLDILKKYNVKATFFVTNQFSNYQNSIKRAYNEGHSIGVHTYSHSYKTIYSSIDSFFNDIDKMNNIIYKQTNSYSKLLRFAGGSSNTISNFNKGIMTKLSKETEIRGYKYFDWNVDSSDTSTTSSTKIANNIIKGIKKQNIAIVLQHDIKPNSVNAVEEVIKYGLSNGYTFLPLDMTSPTFHHSINN